MREDRLSFVVGPHRTRTGRPGECFNGRPCWRGSRCLVEVLLVPIQKEAFDFYGVEDWDGGCLGIRCMGLE